jgi:hypothetical protein
MSDEPSAGTAPAATSRVVSWIIAVAFAILYAGPLFWAVSDLVEYPAQVGGRTPWWLLIVAVVLPVVLYLGGLLIGRGRTPVLRTIVLGAGLCAANALTIAGIALAPFLL